MDFYCAISGLEQAMWDITGKAAGMPVHKLLGGACRERIRVYANGWSGGARTPEQLGEKALRVKMDVDGSIEIEAGGDVLDPLGDGSVNARSRRHDANLDFVSRHAIVPRFGFLVRPRLSL